MSEKEEREPTQPSEVQEEELAQRPSYTPQARTGQAGDTEPQEGHQVGRGYTPQGRTEEEQEQERE